MEGGIVPDTWSTYRAWNDGVAEVIYPFSVDARPVYMDLPDETIRRIGRQVGFRGDAKEGLVQVVRDCVVSGSAFSLKPLIRHQVRWFDVEPDDVPPPCLAYLAVTVLAAERMGTSGSGFAANAYYPRLAQLLGIAADDHRLRVQYSHWAEYLWRSVNRWLERLEGARGLPTAYSLSYRYVGLPMSQALVREGDRQRFPAFFAEYGLVPGAEVSPADIEPYMEAWISDPHSRASQHLRSVWRDKGRERLAGIAAVELASWDGARGLDDSSAPTATGQKARVMANLRSGFMGSSLELSLSVQPRDGLRGDTLEVLAKGGEWLPVIFAPAAAGRWRTHFAAHFDLSSVLEGEVRFRGSESGSDGATFTRYPRPVVPLVFDETQSAYMEQERPQLGVDCLILVRAMKGRGRAGLHLADEVQALLEACARPGFSRADNLPGVPEGWVLFQDVQLFKSPDGTRFNELTPLARNQLSLAGGLRIPSRIRKWSTLKPPEIRAVIQSQPRVRVELAEADSTSQEAIATWSSDEGALIVPLDPLNLDDGDYLISLFEGDAKIPVQQATMRLRSADGPDPGWNSTRRLVYSLGGKQGPRGVISASESFDPPYVDGSHAFGVLSASVTLVADSRIDWNEEKAPSEQIATIQIGEVPPDSCVVTGAHHFHFPTWYGGRTSKYIDGECLKCGLTKRQPGWAPRRDRRDRGRRQQDEVVTVTGLEAVSTSHDRPWDAALDALMHLGGGGISTLNAVAQQLEGTALFESQFVHSMEYLGHISVERNDQGQPVNWEISPTSLAEREDGGWELIGFWPPASVGDLVAQVEGAGGEVAVDADRDAPTSMCVWNVSLDAIASVAAGDCQLSASAGSGILRVLPPLSQLRDALPRTLMPGYDSAERFDPASSSWHSVRHCLEPGAYRTRRGFETVYHFRTEADVAADQAARVSPYLAKFLEANRRGIRLVTYFPEAETVVVPRGTELPVLYGRSLVLMSGRLPAQMKLTTDGRQRKCIAYEGVPQQDADRLVTLLGT